ncbi:hypothetical protein CI238_11610 [Colletotrichum incanum]|uniref:Cell wall protein n=1 Tax=Colletotrichum incanum TaxID=1573173 RepID=A0A161VXC4_COLIC|nr:hypothetical protein CI238_11610 [Colletotrichum incanum]
MQSKIFSAAVATLAFVSVDAAVVATRQTSNVIIIQPGSIVGPTIAFDPASLGFEALAYRALDQVRDDLFRTAALVVELNKAAGASIDDKRAQASAVTAQIQANAAAIKSKIDNLISILQSKAPALTTGGSGGSGPTVPTTGPNPAATAQATIGTVGGIVDRVDALITQARTLNTQARTQISLVGSFLETLLTPTLGQIKTDSSRIIAQAMQQISTSVEQLLSTIGDLSTTAQGVTASLLQRITDARLSLRPILVLGISPDITV